MYAYTCTSNIDLIAIVMLFGQFVQYSHQSPHLFNLLCLSLGIILLPTSLMYALTHFNFKFSLILQPNTL